MLSWELYRQTDTSHPWHWIIRASFTEGLPDGERIRRHCRMISPPRTTTPIMCWTSPTIPDVDYDRLMRALQEIEARRPDLLQASSPTQKVSGSAAFSPVQHLRPMLSLALPLMMKRWPIFPVAVPKPSTSRPRAGVCL